MLTFFHSPEALALKKNVRFPALSFRGSESAKTNGIIPFSHIYMTSSSQLKNLVRYGIGGDKLVTMPESVGQKILSHTRCPLNLSFRAEGIAAALDSSPLSNQAEIKVAIVNGMGRGYGDNVAGLGALQHFSRYLRSRFDKVSVDILQRNMPIQSVIHSRYDCVDQALQLPINVTRFFTYDAYIDLTDLLGIEAFERLPLIEFFIHALSMQEIVCRDKEKRTRLNVNQERKIGFRQHAFRRAGLSDGSRRLVLLHPSASTPLRSIPDELLVPLISDLIDKTDAVFIACVPIPLQHPRLVDMSDQSAGINDLFDIIAASDAVITVGTVVYHVSGNLDIPTLLLPTVKADIQSARLLPSVSCWLPTEMEQYISEKHMSKLPEDIENIRPLWQSLKADTLVQFLQASR